MAAPSFHHLHQSGTFVLVNVHDAGAARIAEAAGAQALGTTSSGHAYTMARRDGVGAVSRAEALRHAESICSAVQVPVSIDAENGWGHSPEDVALTVRDLADLGASGASIEDWSSDSQMGTYEPGLAAERIEAAVEASTALTDPFVICARADGNLYGKPSVEEILARLRSFAAAGAHCVYAPGPTDRPTVERYVQESGAPLNVLIPMGSSLTVDDARSMGVRRISVGGSLYRATMATFAELVTGLVRDGSFATATAPTPTSELENLF